MNNVTLRATLKQLLSLGVTAEDESRVKTEEFLKVGPVTAS